MKRIGIFVLLSAIAFASLPAAAATPEGSTVTARTLDMQGDLSVAGVTVELDRAGVRVATAKTDPYGTATFSDVGPGTFGRSKFLKISSTSILNNKFNSAAQTYGYRLRRLRSAEAWHWAARRAPSSKVRKSSGFRSVNAE